MLLHDDDKGCNIIGEAALRLALVRKEITVFSLYTMLDHMVEEDNSIRRLSELQKARRWLHTFLVPGQKSESGKIYLHTLGSINEDETYH